MSENTPLPPLSDDQVARIERAVFEEIADEPRRQSTPAARAAAPPRRRPWMTALAVAAAFAGGILLAPPLLSAVNDQPLAGADGAGSHGFVTGEAAPEFGSSADGDGSAGGSSDGSVDGSDDAEKGVRDVVTTAEMQLRVADVRRSADAIAETAAEHSGYVEHSDIGQSSSAAEDADARLRAGTGFIRIRVPAGELDKVMRAIGDGAEVVRSSVSREDVTAVAIDLRARVSAAEASTKRLTELMSKSGSVGELIAAEKELNERQAQLEAYQQELKSLDERVAMSTITVQLSAREVAGTADPAGFGDGLLAGWNGLIGALNALVVALGFLLPWLVVAAVAGGVVWLVRRRRRGRSSPQNP